MSPAKNTISMVVLLADSGVYLCNFFKFSPDLHNLKTVSYTHLDVYKRQAIHHPMDFILGLKQQ